MDYLISVVVPLFHGVKYIGNIIKMMYQNLLFVSNYGYQIELIFVNDDPNEAIIVTGCLEHQNPHHPKLTIKLLLNQTNQGIHFSRVRGLREARGEWIHFLDQDDRIEDIFYSSQMSCVGKNDVIVANGITEYGNYTKNLYRYYFMQATVKYIWFYTKYDCRIISPGQCLIKRESIPAFWMNHILQNNGADDYFLWLLMLNDKRKFGINRDNVYIHTYTSQNASLNSEAMIASLNEILSIEDFKLDQRYKKQILDRLACYGVHARKSIIVRIVERMNRILSRND